MTAAVVLVRANAAVGTGAPLVTSVNRVVGVLCIMGHLGMRFVTSLARRGRCSRVCWGGVLGSGRRRCSGCKYRRRAVRWHPQEGAVTSCGRVAPYYVACLTILHVEEATRDHGGHKAVVIVGVVVAVVGRPYCVTICEDSGVCRFAHGLAVCRGCRCGGGIPMDSHRGMMILLLDRLCGRLVLAKHVNRVRARLCDRHVPSCDDVHVHGSAVPRHRKMGARTDRMRRADGSVRAGRGRPHCERGVALRCVTTAVGGGACRAVRDANRDRTLPVPAASRRTRRTADVASQASVTKTKRYPHGNLKYVRAVSRGPLQPNLAKPRLTFFR